MITSLSMHFDKTFLPLLCLNVQLSIKSFFGVLKNTWQIRIEVLQLKNDMKYKLSVNFFICNYIFVMC
jgi:hypothetical protein